jgi:hypothetical protein
VEGTEQQAATFQGWRGDTWSHSDWEALGQGAGKKIGEPPSAARGGWVGQRPRKGPEPNALCVCFVVFSNSLRLRRETPKNVIKKIERKSVLDFLSVFVKTF